MTARRVAPVLLVTCALAAAGCGDDDPPPVASSCTEDRAAIVEALGAAPQAVELPDGATLSACVRDAQTDAALQNVGATLSSAAEDLEERALAGDAAAALQLGYLVGAATEGAKTSNVAAELVRRLERSAAAVDATPALSDDVQRGMRAGADQG